MTSVYHLLTGKSANGDRVDTQKPHLAAAAEFTHATYEVMFVIILYI